MQVHDDGFAGAGARLSAGIDVNGDGKGHTRTAATFLKRLWFSHLYREIVPAAKGLVGISDPDEACLPILI